VGPDRLRGLILLVVLVVGFDDVADTKGTEAGSEMTSVETICSILSRLSKIGVCARLRSFSNTMNVTTSDGLQRYECHQICQSLLDLLCLDQHLLGRSGILDGPLYFLSHRTMLLKAKMQGLKLRKTFAHICE